MTDVKNQSAVGDALKWVVAVALVVLAVMGNVYFADRSLLYRAMGILVVGGFAIGSAAYTRQGVSFVAFLKQARIEVKKVVWPTRQETVQTTLVVVLVVLVMSLLLWGLDSLLGFLVSSIIS